jgi:hypothetical protein
MSLLDLLGVNRIFKAGKPVDPTRKILNFIGDVTIVDNPGSLRTDITIGAGGGGGDGTVSGPATSTAGNVTTWNSADGTKLADSGLALADVATEAYVDAAVSAVPGTPLAPAGQASSGGVTSTTGNTGAAATAARSDHTHGHGDLTGGTLHAVASPSTPGFVSAADKTKLDGIATGATNTPLVTGNQSSPGGVASAAAGNTGTATTGARSDHSHGHGDLLGGTLHAVATGTTPGFCSAADKAKLDGITSGATSTPLVTANQATSGGVAATAGNTGTATTAARSDHSHAHGVQTDGTLHAVVTPSTPGFASAADKTKLDGIATGATSTPLVAASQAGLDVLSTAGSTGTATTAARSDHTHGHGSLAGGTLHAVATGTTPGFCSAADKTKLDGIATGATNTALVTGNQFTPLGVTSSSLGGNTGVATVAARSDHNHGHGDLSGGTLHAVASMAAAGFLSGTDKGRLDTLYNSSVSTKRVDRLASTSGWPGDPDVLAWKVKSAAPTTVAVVTSGSADANVWYVDLSASMPPKASAFVSLDVRIAGPAGQTNVPFGSLVAPRWVLASYTRDNVRAVEIAAQVDASATAAAYQAAHSIAWSGSIPILSTKRYVLELTPESGGLAVSGTRLLSIGAVREFFDGTPESALNATLPDFQFRADAAVLSAGNVASIPNRRGADSLNIGAGTLAGPAADPIFGNAASLLFTGTQWLDSTLPPSAWRFAHDGSGFEIITVFCPTDASTTYAAISTGTPGTGVGFVQQNNSANGSHEFYVRNVSGTITPVGVTGQTTPNVATYYHDCHSASNSPQYQAFTKAAMIGQGPYSGGSPALNTDPVGTLRLGAFVTGTFIAKMRWCETLIYKRILTDYERQIVREYIRDRYGIAP